MIIDFITARDALEASRSWMKKHASRTRRNTIVSDISPDVIIDIICCFLTGDDNMQNNPDNAELLDYVQCIDREVIDIIFDSIAEALDDLPPMTDICELHDIIQNVIA